MSSVGHLQLARSSSYGARPVSRCSQHKPRANASALKSWLASAPRSKKSGGVFSRVVKCVRPIG